MNRGQGGRGIKRLLITRDSGFMRAEEGRGTDCGCEVRWQEDRETVHFGHLLFSCIAAGRGMAFAWRFWLLRLCSKLERYRKRLGGGGSED